MNLSKVMLLKSMAITIYSWVFIIYPTIKPIVLPYGQYWSNPACPSHFGILVIKLQLKGACIIPKARDSSTTFVRSKVSMSQNCLYNLDVHPYGPSDFLDRNDYRASKNSSLLTRFCKSIDHSGDIHHSKNVEMAIMSLIFSYRGST